VCPDEILRVVGTRASDTPGDEVGAKKKGAKDTTGDASHIDEAARVVGLALMRQVDAAAEQIAEANLSADRPPEFDSRAIAIAIVMQLQDDLQVRGQALVDSYTEAREEGGRSKRSAEEDLARYLGSSRSGVRVLFGRQSAALKALADRRKEQDGWWV
jgi:hypothetical protein